MQPTYLVHHGVKGQKWGVRRYRNADGSLTEAGRKHASKSRLTDAQKARIKKTIKVGMTVAAATAIAAYTIKKHPEKIANVISKTKNIKVKDLGGKAVSKGKDYVKKAVHEVKEGTKEGIREGLHDAPKKVAKVVVTGVVLNQSKELMDKYLGKEKSTKIFQANNNKKIDKFWKVLQEDKDKDDDS